MTRPDQSPESDFDLEQEFERTLQRYDDLDLNLEADLDEVAKSSTRLLKKKGIEYPISGTLKEKWLCLKHLHERPKEAADLEAMIEKVRAKTKRLQQAMSEGHEAYRRVVFSETMLDTDSMERELTRLEASKPELQDLIRKARKAIAELKQAY